MINKFYGGVLANVPMIVLLSVAMAGCQDKSAEQNLKLISDEAQATQAAQSETVSDDDNTQNTQTDAANPHDFDALLQQLGDTQTPETTAKPIITDDGKTQVDWSQIDTKTAQADADNFDYPFAIDSQPVINYAKTFGVNAKQAQHAMMLSMASPEALGKVVDQLGGKYLSHHFRDGKNPALIIQTTPDVVSQTHDYVIADKFGEGLVLPVEIIPSDDK
ncbi:hypothetical protein [Moraxella marmotae]|uniref:hypothetical protein n=1 Tax=Moraxella marmotae TaxID=3344520 RepID=UPI0035F40EF4